jgi:hypothetical protein
LSGPLHQRLLDKLPIMDHGEDCVPVLLVHCKYFLAVYGYIFSCSHSHILPPQADTHHLAHPLPCTICLLLPPTPPSIPPPILCRLLRTLYQLHRASLDCTADCTADCTSLDCTAECAICLLMPPTPPSIPLAYSAVYSAAYTLPRTPQSTPTSP